MLVDIPAEQHNMIVFIFYRLREWVSSLLDTIRKPVSNDLSRFCEGLQGNGEPNGQCVDDITYSPDDLWSFMLINGGSLSLSVSDSLEGLRAAGP